MTSIADNIEAGAQTIGEAIGFDPIGGERVTPVMPPRLDGQPDFPEPGIYFGMPEADYHAIFACSASVIKDMTVSPMYAWAKSPLNPEREDDDTFAKTLGRAYHVRICEGREAYDRAYALALDKRDYPDALDTVDSIKAAIVAGGQKPVSSMGLLDGRRVFTDPQIVGDVHSLLPKSPARKEDWVAQLLALNPDAQIWDALVDDHADGIGTRTLIRAEDDKRIQIAARMIENDPELSKAFTGGYAEVSLFWFDEKTGAPCKARVDYLTPNGFSDLKSFSLKSEIPVERAIIREIASRRHFIPVCHYSDGIEAVKDDVRARGASAIHGGEDGRVEAQIWAQEWARTNDDPLPLYVFQATGIAPIARGKIMPREQMGTFGVTHRRVEELRRAFVMNCDVFGAEPWLDTAPIDTIEDTDIPMWATDI